jgi:hypothetical protein
MRVYILSTLNVKKNMLDKLAPYLHEIQQVSYIWSIDGLLQLENDKLFRMKIKDVVAKKTLVGAYPATIDESEFIREEEWHQIPPRSFKECLTLKSYRLPDSSLEWILEYKDNELHDNYFKLPATEDIHSAKTEVLQFLNL